MKPLLRFNSSITTVIITLALCSLLKDFSCPSSLALLVLGIITYAQVAKKVVRPPTHDCNIKSLVIALPRVNNPSTAMKTKNLKEIADALTDILYVTYGAGHAFGINLDKCFDEVQNSNMSKLGENGEPIYNESGKVMKGPNYFKPDLSKFLS